MTTLNSLLGENIINGKKQPVPTSSLTGDGKVIGLYFSAQWCPPCRNFTPKLAKYYEKLKAKKINLEIVFISSDRDKKSFEEYFGQMPWLALNFDDCVAREKVSQTFGVKSVPLLMFLDGKSLAVINKDARSKVEGDPEGNKFPYKA